MLEAAETPLPQKKGTPAASPQKWGAIAAFSYAREQGWLPKNADMYTPARLDSVSLLIMRAFGFKGGLFYRAFANNVAARNAAAHYAYRELLYKGIIQGRTDPAMLVSGDMLLFMVSQALAAGENSAF